MLDLVTPAGCPTRQALVAAVGELVRDMPTQPIHAVARIESHANGYVLNLTLDGGERQVTGSSCIDLSRTLAVILALALDPNAKTDASAAWSEAIAEPSPQPGTPPPRLIAVPPKELAKPPSSAPAPERDRDASVASQSSRISGDTSRVRFGVSGMVLGDSGMLPEASWGAMLVGRARTRAFGLELSASVLAPQWAQVPGVPTRKGGDVWWLGAMLGSCWYPSNRFDASACLGVEAGRLTGTGDNVDRSRSAHRLWLAAVPSASLRLPISADFSIEARLGLAVPALRPQFGLDGYGAFYRPEAVSVRAALGVAFD